MFNALNLQLFFQLRKDQLKKRIVKGRRRE